MRKINRAKRRKASVAALLGAAIFCVATTWRSAAANENAGWASRLGANAAQAGDETGLTTAESGRVEPANFVGYSVGSSLIERTTAGDGRTRLVGWAEPDAAPADEAQAFDASPTKAPVAPVKTSSEDGETAEIGENKKSGEIGARSKTPILRDEPASTARNDGSWASALVSTFGALAIVLGAFFALVAFLKRTGPRNGGSALEIVDSTPVGDKARLLTIRWGNRLILAAKTPENFASLAEIADVEEANAMLAEIERRKEAAATGEVGAKAAAIWKRGRVAASVGRSFAAKGRRQ